MVRVGGGWDTLQGFLLKYDPCRTLQFATLEQKILAFQKGVSNESVPDSPPEMNPLSAVNMFQKQNLKPGTPASVPKSKEKQAQPPGALPPAASGKGNLASASSKLPDSQASVSDPKVASLKGVAKKPPAPHSSVSSSSASLNSLGKASAAQGASGTARNCVTLPKTAETKATPGQKSRDLSKSRLLPSKPSGKTEPKLQRHNHLPSRDKTPTNLSSKGPKLPKGAMHGRPSPSPFQSPAEVAKASAESSALGLGTQPPPPERTLKSRADSAQRLQSTWSLNHPASGCSVSSAKAAQEPRGRNVAADAKRQPQSKGSRRNPGPGPSKSPGRTPLSPVTVSQPAAKPLTASKSAQTAMKGQYSAKEPPQSGRSPAAARKPPSSGKGADSGDKKPTTKKEDDDHYFVMTGSKKLRK